MEKKIAYLLFMVLWITNLSSVFAQRDEGVFPGKHTLYGQIYGSGLFFTANYDYLFGGNGTVFGTARIGGMYYPKNILADENEYTYTVSAHFLYGRKNNYLDVGAGITGASANASGWYKDEHVFPFLDIAFRHQSNRGIFARLGLALLWADPPVDAFVDQMRIVPMPGFAAGYTF